MVIPGRVVTDHCHLSASAALFSLKLSPQHAKNAYGARDSQLGLGRLLPPHPLGQKGEWGYNLVTSDNPSGSSLLL
jgi:hypothetical protein